MKAILFIIAILAIIGTGASAFTSHTHLYNTSNTTDGYFSAASDNKNMNYFHNLATAELTDTGAIGLVRWISGSLSGVGNNYRMYGCFNNTTEIPDYAVITSAKMHVVKYYRLADDGDFGVAPFPFAPAGETIVAADYNNYDSSFSNQSPYINESKMVDNKLYEWVIDADKYGNISKTGRTCYGLLHEYDAKNMEPAWLGASKSSQINFRTNENQTTQWNMTIVYNYDPVFINFSANSSTRITHELEPIQVTAVANDTPASVMTWSSAGLPPGAQFNATPAAYIYQPYYYTQTAVLAWEPAVGQTGNFSIPLTVNNGVDQNTTNVQIWVKKNYILDPTACPTGYTVIGNGDCIPIQYSAYGASTNSTGDPLGGGYNYSRRVYQQNATKPAVGAGVANAAEFKAALAASTQNEIIWVLPNASINLTGEADLYIRKNITIASDRGNSSVGGLIFKDDMSNTQLFRVYDNNSRITGLRFRGPDMETRWEQMIYLNGPGYGSYGDVPESIGVLNMRSNLTVDNNEISGWDYVALWFYYNSTGNIVKNNYIHGNDREALGYGVSIGKWSNNNTISGNIFDWNRHSVATDRDTTTTEHSNISHEAKYNYVLGGGCSNRMDAHGGNDASNKDIPAGTNITVHHNNFYPSNATFEPIDTHLMGIRGIPLQMAWGLDNWAAFYSDGSFENSSGNLFNQTVYNLAPPFDVPYTNMTLSRNWINETRPAATTTAAFTCTPVSGTSPINVTCTETSSEYPYGWLWQYKNATVGWTVFWENSTAQNPELTMIPDGIYDIKLTATNYGGSDDEVKAGYITTTIPPVAAFTKNRIIVAIPQNLTVTDTSTNTPTSWAWRWGDGTPNSTTQNAYHIYGRMGVFPINLEACNSAGCSDTAQWVIAWRVPGTA